MGHRRGIEQDCLSYHLDAVYALSTFNNGTKKYVKKRDILNACNYAKVNKFLEL